MDRSRQSSSRAWPFLPAMRRRPAASRLRWPMRGISSGNSCRCSATAARCCSAKSSAAMACGATFSSRARGRRRFPGAATGVRRSVRCCANTSSARRWRRLAFPLRARSRPSRRASSFSARRRCPARCWRAWPQAISASARFSISRRAKMPRACANSPITPSRATTPSPPLPPTPIARCSMA